MNERRRAALMIDAHRGDVNAARALVGDAIRKTLGVRRWREHPHYVHYFNIAESKSYGVRSPHYTLSVTDDEFADLLRTLRALAPEYGWSVPPVDAYHD